MWHNISHIILHPNTINITQGAPEPIRIMGARNVTQTNVHVQNMNICIHNVMDSTSQQSVDVHNILHQPLATETEMLSFWWNFHHWLHWKLPCWQLPVQSVIEISSQLTFPFQWRCGVSLMANHHCFLCFHLNTSPPRQNGCYFTADIFKCIFMNKNFVFRFKSHWNLFLRAQFNNKSVLLQVMAWCRIGDKPLSQPMITQFIGAYMQH